MTNRRWIDSGASVPDVRDADGLPQWVETRDGGITCGDPGTVQVAWFFLFKGFDLPDFDGWLSALGPCGAKTELLERRALAIQAAKEKKRDAVLRHLEWMMLRRQYLERTDFLLPLARDGKQVRDARSRGARIANATRGKLPSREALEAEIAKLTAGKQRSESDARSIVRRRYGVSRSAVSQKLAQKKR